MTDDLRALSASVLFASTVEPGDGLGEFNLPLTTTELVWQLSNGVPCEIPTKRLPISMHVMEQCFANADCAFKVGKRFTQITPRSTELSEAGRRVLANIEAQTRRE